MNANTIPERDIIAVIIYTFIAFVLMAMVLIVFYHFSRKKIVQNEIEKKDLEIKYQKDLVRSVILTQEDERRRIAQDLHDDISSKLNIVSLNTHLLTTPNLSEKEILELTATIINLTSKALENSRRIAHDLLPPVLEKFGLEAAIEELCVEFRSAKKLNVIFKNRMVFNDHDHDLSLQIFRVLQELMSNSIRHGEATRITINFQETDGVGNCIYTDNGKGFDLNDIKNRKGLGMKNIESRVAIFDGKLTFVSSINQGVNVSFTF